MSGKFSQGRPRILKHDLFAVADLQSYLFFFYKLFYKIVVCLYSTGSCAVSTPYRVSDGHRVFRWTSCHLVDVAFDEHWWIRVQRNPHPSICVTAPLAYKYDHRIAAALKGLWQNFLRYWKTVVRVTFICVCYDCVRNLLINCQFM